MQLIIINLYGEIDENQWTNSTVNKLHTVFETLSYCTYIVPNIKFLLQISTTTMPKTYFFYLKTTENILNTLVLVYTSLNKKKR